MPLKMQHVKTGKLTCRIPHFNTSTSPIPHVANRDSTRCVFPKNRKHDGTQLQPPDSQNFATNPKYSKTQWQEAVEFSFFKSHVLSEILTRRMLYVSVSTLRLSCDCPKHRCLASSERVPREWHPPSLSVRSA